MPIQLLQRAFLAFIVLVPSIAPAADEDSIRVVVDKAAPQLEQFAAQELAGQLRRLFGRDVVVSAKESSAAATSILIGSPQTSPAVLRLLGNRWPKLSDQGFVLKNVPDGKQETLIVGGDTPAATLWAVYELGHHFGIRYLLKEDVYPKSPVKFDLRIDRVSEPVLRSRSYRMINDFAIGSESWPLSDQKKLLAQLAKMKFNRIMLSVYPWQPFVDYQFQGVRKKTALLWYGERFEIPREAPGRNALVGLKVFENPDFAGKSTYKDMTEAGTKYFKGIVSEAKRLGMSVGISISPLEFPREFAKAVPGLTKSRGLNDLTVAPGKDLGIDNKQLRELVTTKIKAYIETYPGLDTLYLTLPEFPEWDAQVDEAWRETKKLLGDNVGSLNDLTESARNRQLVASKERGQRALRSNLVSLAFVRRLFNDRKLLVHSNGSKVQLVISSVDPALHPHLETLLPQGSDTLAFIDYTARRVASNGKFLTTVPADKLKASLILTLADDNVGVLSQSTTRRIEILVREISTLR